MLCANRGMHVLSLCVGTSDSIDGAECRDRIIFIDESEYRHGGQLSLQRRKDIETTGVAAIVRKRRC